MMEIEENREEVLAFIRNWVEEVRELVFPRILEGKRRSMSDWNDIEIKLGVLRSCLEGVMEELQEEGSDRNGQQTSELTSHLFKVEFWTSLVRSSRILEEVIREISKKTVSQEARDDLNSNKEESLEGRSDEKMNRDDSDRDIISEREFEAEKRVELEVNENGSNSLQEEFHLCVAMGTPIEASTEELQGEVESTKLLKGELQRCGRNDSTLEMISDFESIVKERKEIEPDQSEIELELGRVDVLKIGNCARERMDVKTTGTVPEQDAVDLNITVQVVEREVTIGRWRHMEDLAGEFEKMMTKAARGVSATDAVWIIGLKEHQRFEPIYFVVRGTTELGSKPEMEHLGPPPWSRGANEDRVEDRKRDRAQLDATMADIQFPEKTTSWEEDKRKRKYEGDHEFPILPINTLGLP